MSDVFWSHWGWPLATAILGLVFAVLVFRQWLQRRKPHQLAWTVGLLFYGVAAVMESYSEFVGEWDPFVYRIYIVLAASLVGFLGLGTLYLVAKRRIWGHAYLVFNLVCLAIFLYGTLTVNLLTENLVPGITVGGQALYPAEMVASAILLAGFLMAGTLQKGTKAIKERRAMERAAAQ